MDQNYTTEHHKGQHLLAEERHEIEVRLKDGWSIYRIAKHLNRPYNTIKNEIARGTVYLYNGKVARYKAKAGEQQYKENRRNSRRQYKRLEEKLLGQRACHGVFLGYDTSCQILYGDAVGLPGGQGNIHPVSIFCGEQEDNDSK